MASILLLLVCSLMGYVMAGQSIAALLKFTPSPADAALPAGVDKKTGYRMDRYRRAVPEYNPGTETVSTARALQLHTSGEVLFIDVYPPRGLGPDPIDGNWQTNELHENIARSIWLPEVGRGHVERDSISYFHRNLERLTDNNKNAPLLFYCTADCWQSWNAARRAMQWGYEIVFWYPDGTDGWQEENLGLEAAVPVNFLDE